MNADDWLFHIDYRNWVKRSGPLGAPLEASRIRVLSVIERMTGMKLDVVCSAGAKGGTSTDGNRGRRLFSEEFIPCMTAFKLLVTKCGHSELNHVILQTFHIGSVIYLSKSELIRESKKSIFNAKF